MDIAKKYYDIGSSIKATVKNNLTIELFYINCSALKLELANVANEATNQALTALYKKAMAMNTKLCDHYKSISNKLQKKATGLNELIELEVLEHVQLSVKFLAVARPMFPMCKKTRCKHSQKI